MRWLTVGGTGAVLVGMLASGCIIKNSSSGDGAGGSGTGTSGNTTAATSGDTTTTTSNGAGGYGGSGATTAGVGGGGITCDYDETDACDTCFKTSCCDEITACDAECAAAYGAYSACLNDGAPTGYNTNYCKINAEIADGSAAQKLIDCAATSCFNDNACGSEDPQETFTNFAAQFVETYCVGCHTDHYVSPNTSVETAQYRYPYDDANNASGNFWSTPLEDSEWFQQMDYNSVVADGDMLWCGISKDLPAECATMFPGKFPNAQRFPPQGQGVNNLHCWWNANDGETCEQPTDLERAKMNNWIFAGYPQ